MSAIVVAPQFCGPPGWGNGGYVAGLIAQALGGACEVTLAAPTPLSRPLTLRETEAGAQLLDGETLIARGVRRPLDLDAPTPPRLEDARRAMQFYEGFKHHSFPHCFVCGPARAEGDGLRIFTGPLPGRDLVAAVWEPDASLADDSGAVRPEFLWAALDCPGYFAIQPEAGPSVLGRYHGEVLGPARRREPVIVIAWPISAEVRKFSAGSALFDASGGLIAKARATWVRINPGGQFQVAQPT